MGVRIPDQQRRLEKQQARRPDRRSPAEPRQDEPGNHRLYREDQKCPQEDRHCEHDPRARCALASALLKVARLTPPVTPLSEPICTLMGGGDIASRVRRLLDDRTAGSAGTVRRTAGWTAALAAVAAIGVAYAPLLRAVHEATELLVRSLP